MTHPLLERIRTVRRRARQWVVLYGLAASVLVALPAALAAGLTDYALRFEDSGIRLMVSMAVLTALVAGVFRFLIPALRRRWSDLEIARVVEGRYPHLSDRLSSTIHFLSQPDSEPTAGSAELRRAVIAQTMEDVEQLDMGDVIDARRPRRMTVAATATLVVITTFAVVNPTATGRAARRILLPWGGEAWPRNHHLEFDHAPQQVAVGSDVELEVVDRNGTLPERVTIYFWFQGQHRGEVRPRAMRPHAGKMVYRVQNLTRNLKYRAVGGDDTRMPWQWLQVVPPADLDELEVKLTPPAYTGWPAVTASNQLQVLEGTRAQVAGKASKPLQQVSLHVIHGTERTEQVAVLTPDGLQFHFPAPPEPEWRLDESGAYWLDLVDKAGIGATTETWDIRVVPDRPPSVTLECPAGHWFVTTNANLPVRASVKDDLAIETIQLRYRRSDRTETEDELSVIELYRGPERVSHPSTATEGQTVAQSEDARLVRYGWDVSQMKDLLPGTILSFHIAARDRKGQETRSPTRRITLITADEFDDRIALQMGHLADRLAEILRLQREARSQVQGLVVDWSETHGFDRPEVDQLQASELKQRDVEQRLFGESNSVHQRVMSLRDELDTNRAEAPTTRREMAQILAALQTIRRDHLPIIKSRLNTSVKAARAAGNEARPGTTGVEPSAPDSADRAVDLDRTVVGPLRDTVEHQDKTIAVLESMVDGLAQWASYRGLARDVNRIRNEQEKLRGQTEEVRRSTLAKERRELSPQEASDVKKLARRQAELARQLEDTLGRMGQVGDRLERSDPLAAAAITEARNLAHRTALTGMMRQSSQSIGQNRLGNAGRQQQQIAELLYDLAEIMARRQQRDQERLVNNLQQAAKSLQELQRRQSEWGRQIDEGIRSQGSPSSHRQLQARDRVRRKLAEDLDQLARRLQRLQARRAGEEVASAATTMTPPGEAGVGDGSGRSDPVAQARQAEGHLEAAQRELAERIRQLQEDLARQQLAQFQEQLKGLAGRQQSVIDETVRLENLRRDQGQLSEAQRSRLGELHAEQRLLATETDDLSESCGDRHVFQLALRSASQDMSHAASRLGAGDTEETTQQLEVDARSRVEQMIEALSREASPGNQGEHNPESGAQTDLPGAPQPPDVRRLAELKLLRQMQVDVHRRTKKLEESRPVDAGLTAGQERALEQLAQEQGQLAQLMFDMVRASPPRADEVPPVAPPLKEENGLDELDQLLEESLREGLRQERAEGL